MQSIRKLLLAGAAASLICGAAVPSVAVAAPVQLAQTSCTTLTGFITQVISPNEFAMRVNNRRLGSIHVYDTNASIAANGVRLAAGTYAGVTGCFGSSSGVFRAQTVQLAGSQSAYNNRYAMAYPSGPCHVSLFGYVTQVWNNGLEFTLQTTGEVGSIHVYDNQARMNTNGLSIQNGVYTGVYGCFTNNERSFHANEVSLAQSPQSYFSIFHPQVAVTGTVDEVGRGWIGVSTRFYGHVHVLTNQSNVRAGERVSIQGVYNTTSRQIDATSVAII